MKITDVKTLAKHWVEENISDLSGFVGAYLTGSTIWKDEDDLHAPSSDVDIFIVMQGDELPAKIGKINHQNITLEINFVSFTSISDPQVILAQYHIANAFYKNSVLLDPLGQLAPIHKAVKAQFAEAIWVIKRCEDARGNAKNWLKTFQKASELHDQVTALFFAAGVTTHMLLVAGVKNPTIRRRYVECNILLQQHGYNDICENLLTTLGSQHLSKQTVLHHLNKLDGHFAVACKVMKSPYMFAADMSMDLKSIAIGGSAEMIKAGHHREAVFWLIAIYGRSRAVIFTDGTEAQLNAIDADLWSLLADLGIDNQQDMNIRATMIADDIETAWQIAMKIIA
ncbi:MAG: hypothetical protein COB24_12805 [Hyphomicrobiales bacterium]|nr:MAG: hypothetical protein COB24_12805 [Hyphomicrobiales bacterium]